MTAASGGVPTVSVIVPFRNAAAHLGGMLESLAAQKCDRPWEVIAVDNGSTDHSTRIAAAFAPRLSVTIVEARQRANPSYARNAGARLARGAKLLFVDADDEVSSEYVAAMAAALDANDVVTSRVDSTILNPSWVRDAHGEPWQQTEVLVFFDFLPAAGVNIGIGRDLFAAAGGFDERFNGSEDIAFSWHLQLSRGARIHFVEGAVYRYRYRDTYRALFLQGCRWGRDNALLYRQFRKHGMPKRPWHVGVREWRDVVAGLLTAPAGRRPALVVRLGYCAGRLTGSIRHGVLYL